MFSSMAVAKGLVAGRSSNLLSWREFPKARLLASSVCVESAQLQCSDCSFISTGTKTLNKKLSQYASTVTSRASAGSDSDLSSMVTVLAKPPLKQIDPSNAYKPSSFIFHALFGPFLPIKAAFDQLEDRIGSTYFTSDRAGLLLAWDWCENLYQGCFAPI